MIQKLNPNLTMYEGCLTEKDYLFSIFEQLQLQQTLHLRFCHIMCAVQQNIEHKPLVAQWDALKITWHNLKEALNQLEIKSNAASTSYQ